MIPTRTISTGRVEYVYVVREIAEGVYRYTRPKQVYTVDVFRKFCTCPARKPCKHLQDALLHHLEQLRQITPSSIFGRVEA